MKVATVEAKKGTPELAHSPVMRRLYELAESRGVEVYWLAFKRVNGCFGYDFDGRPVIALNPRLRGAMRSLVFAHELAHFALGNARNGLAVLESETWDAETWQRYRQMEAETDRFARRLLHFIRRGTEAHGRHR